VAAQVQPDSLDIIIITEAMVGQDYHPVLQDHRFITQAVEAEAVTPAPH
jgi:hypothetical protein